MKTISFIFCLFLLGCTRVTPADPYRVTSIIQSKIDKEVRWKQCTEADDQLQQTIQDLLQQELTVSSAVQIALLNNPEIQAIYEEIGIAHADLMAAGLFQNPFLEGYARFPDHHSLHLNAAFSVTQNFLDLFLIPLRQKIANAELQQAYLRVANAVLNLAFSVQETFYTLQAAEQKQELLNQYILSSDATYTMTKEQKDAGNINELEYYFRLNDFLTAKAELTQNQLEIVRLREEMNRWLAVSSSDYCWRIVESFPELPAEEVSLECLDALALSQRLDLESVRWEVERIARTLGVKQWWAYTNLALAFSTEQEAEGFLETGPAFAGSLPIFNYGQADRSRLFSLYRQSQERLKALEIDVLAEVHRASDQLLLIRNLALFYQNELLPMQEETLTISEEYYSSMSLSIYRLLDLKKQQNRLQIQYQESLRDYWIARVRLDRAVGMGMSSCRSVE